MEENSIVQHHDMKTSFSSFQFWVSAMPNIVATVSEMVSSAVSNQVKDLSKVLRSFVMHNFMHYDRIVMLTSNSKSIPLKHSQNVSRSNFPVTLSVDPSCPIVEFIKSV